MEAHNTKNILIKCSPATNHLLCKLINKSPSAHLINLGSVSWKIPFETFCKVKLLFSSLVKPTFQKSLQLPLTEFLVTFGVETFGVWLKKVLPPRAPSSHLPPVAASVANRPQPYHQTWRRVREGEPQESFNWFLENEQVGKTTDTSTFKTLLCQRQSQPFHSCRTKKVDTGDMVKILLSVKC